MESTLMIMNRYRFQSLPWLSLAVAVALLAWLSFGTSTVSANEECEADDVYCGTVTAGYAGIGRGYSQNLGGSISPITFSYNGSTYTIRAIYTYQPQGYGKSINFSVLSPSTLSPLHDLALVVGGNSYAIDSPDDKISAREYRWATSFEMTYGQSYTVRILVPPAEVSQPQAPTQAARPGGISMRWNTPTIENGSLAYYQIRWREQGGAWQETYFHSSHTHHTIWGVNGDTVYEAQVRAAAEWEKAPGVWMTAEGPWSPVSSTVTLPSRQGSTSTSSSHKPTYSPRSTAPPPMSYYDANGEPPGKKYFKNCTHGTACNE